MSSDALAKMHGKPSTKMPGKMHGKPSTKQPISGSKYVPLPEFSNSCLVINHPNPDDVWQNLRHAHWEFLERTAKRDRNRFLLKSIPSIIEALPPGHEELIQGLERLLQEEKRTVKRADFKGTLRILEKNLREAAVDYKCYERSPGNALVGYEEEVRRAKAKVERMKRELKEAQEYVRNAEDTLYRHAGGMKRWCQEDDRYDDYDVDIEELKGDGAERRAAYDRIAAELDDIPAEELYATVTTRHGFKLDD